LSRWLDGFDFVAGFSTLAEPASEASCWTEQLFPVGRCGCGISSIFKLQIWSVVSGWLCLFMFVRVLEGTTFNEPEASRGASSDSSSQQRAELKEPAKPKSKA
jgi:hypothetical protein